MSCKSFKTLEEGGCSRLRNKSGEPMQLASRFAELSSVTLMWFQTSDFTDFHILFCFQKIVDSAMISQVANVSRHSSKVFCRSVISRPGAFWLPKKRYTSLLDAMPCHSTFLWIAWLSMNGVGCEKSSAQHNMPDLQCSCYATKGPSVEQISNRSTKIVTKA